MVKFAVNKNYVEVVVFAEKTVFATRRFLFFGLGQAA